MRYDTHTHIVCVWKIPTSLCAHRYRKAYAHTQDVLYPSNYRKLDWLGNNFGLDRGFPENT